MCGIAGIFDVQANRTIDETVLNRMRDRLIHRGPDEAGSMTEPGVGLAHRRLSIIDLSSGQQPLRHSSQPVSIVFNGEIYNFQEIREQLSAKGHEFHTASDTEVIVNAWIEWGEDCVSHLRGMFAFALWDGRKQTLFCARDRLGVKPLLYHLTDDGFFIFASEHKALLVYPGISLEINPKAVECYFALGYISDPDSIYTAIQKLPAGHTLTLRKNQTPQVTQYWDIPFKTQSLDSESAEEEFYTRLKEATEIRLISEVPLGAFLSGGVDSSSVVSIMSKLQETPVKTCSIGFDDPKYNESEFANELAQHCHTNHFQKTVSSDDYDLIDTLVEIYDEPYADSSALPTYRVCELAKTQVTVALSGDGADELMSGYRHHAMHLREEKLRALLPYSIRRILFGTLAKIYPKADWAPRFLRAKSTFQGLSLDSVSAYFQTVCQNGDQIRSKLFSEKLKEKLNGYNALDIFKQHAARAPKQDSQSLIQYLDAKTYLVSDILTKVDRASMAHSLEVRSPFMDYHWIEWISGIDPKYKFDGTTGKSLLKRTMEPHLPKDILYRKKMGFSVPLCRWFRGPLKQRVHQVLSGDTLAKTGWFNADYLSRIESEHQSGLRDHSTLIWSLVMFEGFLRQHEKRLELQASGISTDTPPGATT
jgi:asparagine synthase (glutamine-hydrolysing)